MTESTAYIPLPQTKQRLVILGSSLLWFYNLVFGFAMSVVLPSVLEYYGMMGYYAILGGITSLIGCIVTPIGGKLGDRFGRRKICLGVGFIRMILMLLCAIPTNGSVFFSLYVAGNLFGGLLNAYPAAILSDVTTPVERPHWFGIFGTINGAALLIGMLGGGIAVDLLGPLSLFWIMAPFGFASLILLFCYYPNRFSDEHTKLDIRGTILLGAGASLALTWCAFGDSLFPRVSVLGISVLIMGLALLAVLLLLEQKTADPLVNLNLFKDSHFTMSFFTHMLIAPMMCLCSSVLILYGQVGLGLSATMSSTLSLPKNILFLLLPSILGGWVAKNQQRFRTAFLTCGGAIAIASLISATWDTATSLFVIYAVMLIFGLGTSCQSICIQPYMQMTVSPTDMGSATSMVQFANSVGVAIFNAFYNIFYNTRYTKAIELGGGSYLAQAISETFSCMSLVSAVGGIIIIILALRLIPKHLTETGTFKEKIIS